MDENFARDLTRARLYVMRKQWNQARPLLESLLSQNPTDRETADLLLRVEKEQAVLEGEKWRSEDGGLSSKNQFSLLAIGLMLIVFLIYGSYKTAVTIHDLGWHSDVVLRSGISNTNRPFEEKLPVKQMLWILPLSGGAGVVLIRISLQGFRIA